MGNICSIFSLHYISYRNDIIKKEIFIDYYRPILITLDNGDIEEYYNYNPINTS